MSFAGPVHNFFFVARGNECSHAHAWTMPFTLMWGALITMVT